MKILIAAALTITLLGCAPIKTKDDGFVLGDEVPPPWGCEELRQRGGEC